MSTFSENPTAMLLVKNGRRTFRGHLTTIEPSLLRDWIMTEQSPANYMGICANMPELRAILSQQALTGPIRHYALQHFVYVAPRLSKAQMVDLLPDAQLPWEEQAVIRAVRAWERENNDTLLCPAKGGQVDYLNICWTNEFDVCGERNVVPGVLPTREAYTGLSRVTHMCTWGELLVLVYESNPCEIFIRDILSDVMVTHITQPFPLHITPCTITCMLVHGDKVYAGTKESHLLVCDLRNDILLSRWFNVFAFSHQVLSISQEGDLLWIGHEFGNVTAKDINTQYNDLGVGFQQCDQLAVQAWKQRVAFSVCDGTRQIRVWDASSGTVQNTHNIELPAFGVALALHNETMLCVADNRGAIHAYALNTSPPPHPLWTLQMSSPSYTCTLLQRGEILLYFGTSSETSNVLVVVNTDGVEEHVLRLIGKIVQLANTKKTVYALKAGGEIKAMHA